MLLQHKHHTRLCIKHIYTHYHPVKKGVSYVTIDNNKCHAMKPEHMDNQITNYFSWKLLLMVLQCSLASKNAYSAVIKSL